MGASLNVPVTCPVCNELTRDPVVLKCNHRFCPRCIGDLWSVTPHGPYHCPEWRCTTVYQTLPFDRSVVQQQSKRNPSSQARGLAATSSNGDHNQDSPLRRPSLTSRLLGKRKASTTAPEEPYSKRSAPTSCSEQSDDTEAPSTSVAETPTTSVWHQAAESNSARTSPTKVQLDLKPSGCGGDKSDHGDVAPVSDVSNNTSVQTCPSSPEVVTLDDSSNEVDICDAPLTATPKKPASPPHSDSSPRLSSPESVKSPAQRVQSPLPSAKHPGSPGGVGVFSLEPEKAKAAPLPCHYCPKAECQPAVKTCLVCGASMCSEHLRPHLESPVFQSHTLVPPMEDVSSWRCQEHQEINRIYCRQCAACVCTVCTVIGCHRDHACISIKEAERELRGNLKEEIKQLQNAEQQVMNTKTELTQQKETSKLVLGETREGVQQQYRAMREVLEQEEQQALACVLKEENRVLGGLEEKLGHLHSSLLAIQKGLHTLEALADTRGDTRIQDQAFIMDYSRVAKLASTVAGVAGEVEAPEEVDRARLKCLQKWTEKRLETLTVTEQGKDRDLYRLFYGIVPSLDADTAHLKLQLTDGNRTVTYSESQQLYDDRGARFGCFPQVLSSRSLAAGRWYWEVDVSADDGRWKVGVCEALMERKGQKDSARLGFNPHSWCLACDRRKLEAQHNKVTAAVAAEHLQKVGVSLDFQVGTLSFFSVTPGGSLALLHSFRHRFSAPLHPAFSVSKTQLTVSDLFQA